MKKILLVEDDELSRIIMVKRLRGRGYSVICAVDGQQAIDLAQLERPDIILMDINLPVLDGWEATREIKRRPGLHEIPIVGLSASAMTGDRDLAVMAGCDDYASKAIHFDKLMELVLKIFEASNGAAVLED